MSIHCFPLMLCVGAQLTQVKLMCCLPLLYGWNANLFSPKEQVFVLSKNKFREWITQYYRKCSAVYSTIHKQYSQIWKASNWSSIYLLSCLQNLSNLIQFDECPLSSVFDVTCCCCVSAATLFQCSGFVLSPLHIKRGLGVH